MKLGNCKSRAFTIVEFLVVMAILALLAAIMMPTLQKTGELARRGVCASNQRQILIALRTYGSEENGCYPLLHVGSRRIDNVFYAGFLSCWGVNYSHGYRLVDATGCLDSAMVFDCPGREKFPGGRPEDAPGAYSMGFFNMAQYGQRFGNWNISGYNFRVYRYNEVVGSAPDGSNINTLRDDFCSRYSLWDGGMAVLFDHALGTAFHYGVWNHSGGINIGYADGAVRFDTRWDESSPFNPYGIPMGEGVCPTYAWDIASVTRHYMDCGDEH